MTFRQTDPFYTLDLTDPKTPQVRGELKITGYSGYLHPIMGLTLPGMTVVCGDSHTSTHGAFGALAFGIGTSEVEHVLATQTLPIEAEIGLPQWVFGQSRYVFVGDEIWLAYREAGIDNLATLLPDGRLEKIEIDATEIESVTNYQDGIVATVSSWKAESLVTFVNRKEIRPLSKTRDLGIDENWFPVPETFTYQTSDSEKAHALFYSPTNPEYEINEKEKPPLIVLAHGGPTAAARRQLQLSITYWTSRGFGVADVDYRGSTGYGRSFRNRLRNSWGLIMFSSA